MILYYENNRETAIVSSRGRYREFKNVTETYNFNTVFKELCEEFTESHLQALI